MSLIDQNVYNMMMPRPQPAGVYNLISVRPVHVLAHKAMAEFCVQLPMRLARRIVSVQFCFEGVTEPYYEVTFMGGKNIKFYNIDDFPADADIGRVCVEAP